jgi:hypothetical protein
MLPSVCLPAQPAENTRWGTIHRNGRALYNLTMHITRVPSGLDYQGDG